jgi:phasin family protein
MSQKPRTGAQGVPASDTGKDAAAKVSPVKTEAARLPLDVKAQPVVKAEPAVPTSPVIKPEPVVRASAIVAPPAVAPPMVTPPGVTAPKVSEPVVKPPVESLPAAKVQTAPAAIAATEIVKATVSNTADAAAKAVATAKAIEPTKPTLTQGMKTMMKSTEDLVAFGQANLEAFVKSGQIWSAGVQELTKQMATSAKASFEESVSTFKAISTAKSVKEAIDLQSTFAKSALEKAMAESNKLTDASIKLTEQTLAPITARVTVAVETFGKSA